MRWIPSILMALAALPARAQKPANLLPNPGFEQARDNRAAQWDAFEQGYALDSAVHHSGARSVRCDNSRPDQRRGAGYVLVLNQREPAPLLVTGWSRAKDVGGSRDGDYSIYLDLEYTDGTPLWGQVAPFATGTHDWQYARVLVTPTKPVKEARIYALFRNHTGTAWFDDFSAIQLTGSGIFDSQPIQAPTLPRGADSGWFARDVAADSAILSVQALTTVRPGRTRVEQNYRALDSIGLRIAAAKHTGATAVLDLADTTGRDRAITIYWVERFDGRNPVWWNDIRSSVPAATGERANLTSIGDVGATGAQSLYPFGCVTGDGSGRMVGVPPSLGARVYRIGYHAASHLLYVAFDVALTGKNLANRDPRGHGTVTVAVDRANTDAHWGFRAAAAAYYKLNPAAFERRAKADGLWMPFTNPATVQNVEDFGFAYHEGDNSIASDDKLGILSFRYTEPMTWWMAMDPALPRTYDSALDLVRKHLAGSNEEMKCWAQAVINSGSEDETGKYNVEFQNAPWANGAVWTLNPNPRLPHKPDEWTKARLSYATEMADRIYGPGASGTQDGEYLDSIEGWANVLDFRPVSLEYAQTPPTFTTDTHRPVIPTWFSVFELARYMSEDLHRRGKLLMANSTPWRLNVFLPVLDVAGTETNWNPDGKWQPDSDAVFNLRRTLCYHKPYLLLQNTDFDRFSHADVERYFQRSVFYGVFPSFFSANAATKVYWENPALYNRDRDLFRKYIPIIKKLSAAGWEPVTYARSSNPSVCVERFGHEYLTMMNSTDRPQEATVTLTGPANGGQSLITAHPWTEVVTGRALGAVSPERGSAVSLSFRMSPHEVWVVRMSDR